MSHANKFWWIGAIADCAQRHGVWASFRLAIILLRGALRDHFGRHQKTITNLWFVAMFVAGLAITIHLRQDAAWPQTPIDVLLGTAIFAVALSLTIVSLGKFCLSGIFQQQLWLYCLGACVFATFLGGCGYFFYETWNDAYIRNPASATLSAVLGGGVIIGFRTAIGWFFRGLIQPAHRPMDPSEIAGLTKEGRRRVCIHEAGHALCYGLCNGIPEDASIGIDTDSYNLMMGVVTLPTPRDPTEVTKSLLEWQMLCLMAGGAAERHFLGEESICGSGDMAAMHASANMYLMAGYGEAYHAETKDEAEIEANRRAIERLRQVFKTKAARLMVLNADQCLRLADVIDKIEYLGCEDISEITKSVIVPEGTESLTWPRSVIMYSEHSQ